MAFDTFIVFVGVYADVEAAEADYELVKDLHTKAGLIDAYDAAVIQRRADGKVKIARKHETPTRVGGVLGGGVGLATGLVVALFPFAAIGGGLLAATAAGGTVLGAVAGHAAAGMSRDDLKELGESLDAGQAGLLSGGLDSSSVVGMAHALGRQFETFSLVFPDVPEADERPYIEAVTNRLGAPAHLLAAAPIDPNQYRRRAAGRADLPELPSDAMGEPLLDAMRARGLRVALTGVGGDFGFAGSLLHYADFLQQGDVSGLLRQYRADRRTADVGWSPRQLISQGVRFLIPQVMRRAARPLARQFGWGVTVPRHIDRGFAARTNLLDRLNMPRGAPGPALPTRRHVCELFESGWTCRLIETIERAAADYGLELRHPFYDRRLVEFAVAIPESQRWRGPTTKFVMREAMRQLLPETVYARTGKADASAFVPRAVDVLGGEAALNDLEIAALGWVRPAAIVDAYRRARGQFEQGADGYSAAMFNVWMTLAVNAWYRSMFVEDSSHERLRERQDSRRQPSGRSARHAARPEAVQIPGAR